MSLNSKMRSANQGQYKSIIDDYDVTKFEEDVSDLPVKFKFELDEFQKRSIYRLSQSESVFVSVPTSAGKTVIALYAIGQSRKNNRRAIYTSPIKSLSNQKYREFANNFGTVGIITGDITLNRNAPILVMTTEILRSMLYKNDLILKDVDMVIFDEFHYIANQERGGVWEESVIRMPDHIKMAFLSASMPNAVEISDWISKTKKRSIYIEMHNKRPIPLNHCLYVNDRFLTITDNQKYGNFFDRNEVRRARRSPLKGNPRDKRYLMSLILNLQSNKLLPALIFEFSIRSIEEKTNAIINSIGINLLTNEEKKYVENFFKRVLQKIPCEDRNLPQIRKMFSLLKCGVAMHHSGILPILKEAVEILLSDGYVKLVFCTSTIGMGLNLPVRTCCFSGIQKFNGKEFNDLTSTEYQQMSGRAGRRGLDNVGTSIVCIGKKFPEESYLNDLFCGEPEEIKSQFQINFKMVINSISDNSGMKINELLRKSFLESANNSKLSRLNTQIERHKNLLSKIRINDCPFAENEITFDIEDINDGAPIRSFTSSYENVNFVNSQIVTEYSDEFEKALKIGMLVLYMNQNVFVIAIINNIVYNSSEIYKVSLLSSKGEVFEVTQNEFECLHILVSSVSNDIESMSKQEKIEIMNQIDIKEKLNTYCDFMEVRDAKFIEYSNLHNQIILEILESPCFMCDSIVNHLKKSTTAENLSNKIKCDENILYNKELKEYESYLKFLKESRYINELDGKYSLCLKGVIACDIYGHEIISTELICSDIFDDCTKEEVAALCSCLVAQRVGRNNKYIEDISSKMTKKYNKMFNIVNNVVTKMKKYSIQVDEDDFIISNINPNVMYPVYLWAKGESFSTVISHGQTILEGQMASIITKVFSLLTSYGEIARDRDNEKLAMKFNEAAKKIERGIIFAKSIYIEF